MKLGEKQQGFRRSTADGMFILRQLVEKKLVGQENMVLGFIDLERHTIQFPEIWPWPR